MGRHGTKIVVFNLWFNDAWEMELDFVTDDEVRFFLFRDSAPLISHFSTPCVYFVQLRINIMYLLSKIVNAKVGDNCNLLDIEF